MKLTRTFSLFILFAFCAAPFVAIAQAQTAERPFPAILNTAIPPVDVVSPDGLLGSTPSPAPAGNVSCFEYYRFGSVVTNIAPPTSGTIPGATITFSGTITNQNTYPLVGLDLYVKIFRKQTDVADVKRNGHNLVAQFVAIKGVSMKEGGVHPFSFEWVVPPSATPGEYMLATYAMTGEAYNLSGLSFTDDVTGATAQFVVRGQTRGTLAFDKNNVTMNERPFLFATFIPKFKKEEAVVVSAPFVNTTNSPKTVTVLWKQYHWDGLRESLLLEKKIEKFTIPANSTHNLSYTATKYNGAVTYLVADAEYLGAHSILDMRFAREGVSGARINFPSITAFPLVKGQSNTMFSCLHAVGGDTLSGGALEITLADPKGAVIAEFRYEGDVTGAMMGVKQDFMPKKSYDNVTLTATLSRNGVVEDVGTVHYDCRAIDPSMCTPQKTLPMSVKFFGALLFLGGIAFVLLYLKKKKVSSSALSLMLVLVCGVLVAGSPSTASANTTSWTSGAYYVAYTDVIEHCTNAPGCVIEPLPQNMNQIFIPAFTMDGIVAVVNYEANAYDNTTSALIADGSSVPVGTVLRFAPVFSATDISWVGTGYYNDSPYGQWGVDGTADVLFLTVFRGPPIGTVDLYASLQVPYPVVSYTHGGTATLACNGDGSICTVNSAGTITTAVQFGGTEAVMYGKFFKYSGGSLAANIWYPAGFQPSRQMRDWNKVIAAGCDSVPSSGYMEFTGPAYDCLNDNANQKLTISVPLSTINIGLNAFVPDAVPSAPTIVGAVSGLVDTPYLFTFTATDSDGDNLHYEIDWDNDGIVDACAPAACTDVVSGTSRSASMTWGVPAGAHTLKARTIANGLRSGWTSHIINIALPAAPPAPSMPADFSIGSGAVWSVAMTGGGTSVDCEFTRTSVKYGDIAPAMVGLSHTATAAIDAFIGAGTATYSARCADTYGQWSPSASTIVTVLAPVPFLSIVPLAGGTIIPNIPVGDIGNFSFTVRNTGETGSVISGVVTAVDVHFTCVLGCTYDSPIGGAVGLNAGAPAQTVSIAFAPTAPGALVSAINFPGNAGVAPNVTGIGISPLVFAPSPVSFGDVVITKSKTLKLRISNISSAIIAPFALNLPAGPFTCDSGCASVGIAAGGYRDAVIRFTPIAPPGVMTRTITLSGRTETLSVSGNGVPPVFNVIEE
jgi:hypothetical protein